MNRVSKYTNNEEPDIYANAIVDYINGIFLS